MPIRPSQPSAASLASRALRLLGAASIVSLLVLAGCAGRTPITREPDVAETPNADVTETPVWIVTEGDPSVFPQAADGAWWQDGGSMRCVVSSVPPDEAGGAVGAPTRDEAIARAAERLLPGAFEMLDRRGAALSPLRRGEATEEFEGAVARGESSAFPRVAIREAVVELCRTSEGAEHWRARLLAEYPIGVLRGDVAHARWEGRRLQREMDMRIKSAEDLLADGRWLEGMLQMHQAHVLLRRLGGARGDGDAAARLNHDFTDRDGVFAPRFVRVGGQDPLVLASGGREVVRYRLEYRLGGVWVPASGVPVVVESGDLVRPVVMTAETGPSGEIAFEVAAGVEPGDDQFRIVAEVFPREHLLLPAGIADQRYDVAAEFVQRVIVLSTREATVCAEVDVDDEGSAARVRTALATSLDVLGASLVECGPDAALVVSADVALSVTETHGAWLATVVCEARVFDQRFADEAGAVEFEVRESSGSSARDAEALALRETGRLIAVYLDPRLPERRARH